jgi:hypothetical protein
MTERISKHQTRVPSSEVELLRRTGGSTRRQFLKQFGLGMAGGMAAPFLGDAQSVSQAYY